MNDVNYKLENITLNAKVKFLESEILKKDIELLILKDENFEHIDINKIDIEGFEMLEYSYKKLGYDGLKLWLLKMYPKPESIYQKPKIRMLSEVLLEINNVKV